MCYTLVMPGQGTGPHKLPDRLRLHSNSLGRQRCCADYLTISRLCSMAPPVRTDGWRASYPGQMSALEWPYLLSTTRQVTEVGMEPRSVTFQSSCLLVGSCFLLLFFLRHYLFGATLSSQQNWEECTDFPCFPCPTHAPFPTLQTSPTRVVHLLHLISLY